jgi:hypothetical protein
LKVVVDHEDCFPVGAGTRVVFGASPAAAPRVDAELDFSLGNSGERIIVAGVAGVVLDRVDYDGTVEGIAWQIDPSGDVCLARPQDEYLEKNFGTPGDANPSCPPVLGPGMCFDSGGPRDIVSPGPDDASITEWMANPSSVGNREGEWVEVRLDAAVDLNGLVLSDLGGIEGVDADLSLSLNNSDEAIALSIGGQILDRVTYDRSTAGVATQVDELGNLCEAVHAYGDGDLGTPGSANPRCF